MKTIYALVLSLMISAPAVAQEAITYPFEGSFDEATFAVENAIINQGLVVDYVSHVGEMLNRTGKDVGSDREVFAAADVFIFCSALLSRKVMEEDPLNIAFCPYGIFVIDQEGVVTIGFRDLPSGPMQAVEDLLHKIAKEAAAN